MKGKIVLIGLAVSLLLTGCSLFDGSYVHVVPHQEQESSSNTKVVSADNYRQLRTVVEGMVDYGAESGVINVADFDQSLVEKHMTAVAFHIRETYPIGAYAVEEITYEIGTNSGRPAIAVNISYRHSRIEIQKIRNTRTMDNAKDIIGEALKNFQANVVLEIQEYQETDFSQIVEDYAEANPGQVMEMPQVASAVYGTGNARVVELTFTYQNSRDALRTMQERVEDIFDSAALYVSGEAADSQKLSQLYGFLMERFDYTLETSITPAYSLLNHGVGDSRAFAVAYAAMCRQAGLECHIVKGTRLGEPWTWNIVCDNGNYYHVDLLRSSADGGFDKYLDDEMTGYVWDYSAYPQCNAVYVPPVEQPAEPTVPEETAEETVEMTQPEETKEILE